MPALHWVSSRVVKVDDLAVGMAFVRDKRESATEMVDLVKIILKMAFVDTATGLEM